VRDLKLSPGLQEDKVWDEVAAPALNGLSSNVRNLLLHGFSEMVNNAIEHSEGDLLTVGIIRTGAAVKIRIIDNGVGVFNKVTRALHLDDERDAILELAKGKVTTDSSHHTGEGIFFTSRMFDTFSILSGHLFFHHTMNGDDWLIDDTHPLFEGTCVEMRLATNAKHTPMKIFEEFSPGRGEHGFVRTRIPVVLARYGQDNLVSRSQARRLLARVDKFREVVLSFKDVPMIGQAFADEIFRVFQSAHPEVHLSVVHANTDVKKMISHVEAGMGA
jgi:anti-sigma regulatory factor (Ser/Thr protein kinase)